MDVDEVIEALQAVEDWGVDAMERYHTMRAAARAVDPSFDDPIMRGFWLEVRNKCFEEAEAEFDHAHAQRSEGARKPPRVN